MRRGEGGDVEPIVKGGGEPGLSGAARFFLAAAAAAAT